MFACGPLSVNAKDNKLQQNRLPATHPNLLLRLFFRVPDPAETKNICAHGEQAYDIMVKCSSSRASIARADSLIGVRVPSRVSLDFGCSCARPAQSLALLFRETHVGSDAGKSQVHEREHVLHPCLVPLATTHSFFYTDVHTPRSSLERVRPSLWSAMLRPQCNGSYRCIFGFLLFSYINLALTSIDDPC